MKHHRLVSKMPQKAQQDVQDAQNNFEAKIIFLQRFAEQLIQFSFGKSL